MYEFPMSQKHKYHAIIIIIINVTHLESARKIDYFYSGSNYSPLPLD